MKRSHALAFALFALSPGCDYFEVGRPHTFFRYAARNVALAPVDATHECLRVDRNRSLGEQIWSDICRKEGRHAYSPDYAAGFVAGFTDFLTYGGSGDAPPLPPHCYRRPQYETPAGRQAVEDWFTGFERGVAEARASGRRENILVPLGRPPLPPTDPGALAGPRSESPATLPPPTPEGPAELAPPQPPGGPGR
jgi:hypothetical protein